MAQFDPKKAAEVAKAAGGDKKGKKEDKKPKEEKKPQEKKKEEPQEPMDDEPKPVKQKDPFETIPKVIRRNRLQSRPLKLSLNYDDFLVRMNGLAFMAEIC